MSAQASFIKCTVKRLPSRVLQMTHCHLLPASGQAGIRSPMNWLQSLHLAVRVAGEGNVQFSSPAKKRTKAIHTLTVWVIKGRGHGAM